jgi:hypothetical protein
VVSAASAVEFVRNTTIASGEGDDESEEADASQVLWFFFEMQINQSTSSP